MRKKREVRLWHTLITVCFVAVIVFIGIVLLDSGPQIPLILGCLVAGLVSVYLGYSWDEILEGMLKGIEDSLEAILILMLIGMLAGSWITAGTVPSMIWYGLRLVTPQMFLPATMFICLLIAFAIGSWGTVGTMGLAFMGMGLALNIPAPLTAGAVISGAYMGEVISPLSDATNLAAGVTGEDAFAIVKRILPLALAAGAGAIILYAVFGLRCGSGNAEAVKQGIGSMLTGIRSQFVISPLALLPLVIILICIIIKLPAIPSMLFGALAGMVFAGILQGESAKNIFLYAMEGYISRSGNETLDTLLSAGGLKGMLESVSVVLIAMAFGGIMKKTGQMEVLVRPLVRFAHGQGGMIMLTVCTCVGMNAVLPDQYLGISMPGQMYADEYDRRGISRVKLAAVLLGGGAVTSPLIPWNTCGIYCRAVLGVQPGVYAPFAFYGMLLPVITIAGGFLMLSDSSG